MPHRRGHSVAPSCSVAIFKTAIQDSASGDVKANRGVLQMDERLTAVEDLADLYQKRFEGASKTVADLRNAVHSMFQTFGCSTAVVRELLGDGGVTDRNMLQHLSIIEQRVNEILRMYGGSLTRIGADMEHLKARFLAR